jgi:hypothetical protein
LGALQQILLALQADVRLAIGKPEAALASVAAELKAVESFGAADGAPAVRVEVEQLS